MDFQRFKPHLPWITLLVLVAAVGIVDDTFLRPANLLSLAGDIVPLFIMALGLTFAIYIGGIDLSAQSMANLITVVASVYLAPLGWGWRCCVWSSGFGMGTMSGYVTTRLLVPSFISTLAVGGMAFSLAQYPVGAAGAEHGCRATGCGVWLDDRQDRAGAERAVHRGRPAGHHPVHRAPHDTWAAR